MSDKKKPENVEPKLQPLVIRSEDDAIALLVRAHEGKVEPFSTLMFDGWPTLNLHLTGEKFHQSITPSVMKGLLEFQRQIYHAYALAKYDDATRRLNSSERSDFEIRVDVKDGSSDLGINFTEIAIKLVEQLGSKMTPGNIVFTVISIAIMFFGNSAFANYLNNRKEIKLREIDSATERARLESTQFISQEETNRMKVIQSMALQHPLVQKISNIAQDAQGEIVRTMRVAETAEVGGIAVEPEDAEMLTRNTRRLPTIERLDGIYQIKKIDWTNPTHVKVRVENITTRVVLDADVQDETLDGRHKKLLKDAEWGRGNVQLEINAKRIGDVYREVVILGVKKITTNEGPPLPP